MLGIKIKYAAGSMLRLPQSSSSISGINRPLNARGVVALMHNVRKAQNALNQVVWVHEFLTIELMVAGREVEVKVNINMPFKTLSCAMIGKHRRTHTILKERRLVYGYCGKDGTASLRSCVC